MSDHEHSHSGASEASIDGVSLSRRDLVKATGALSLAGMLTSGWKPGTVYGSVKPVGSSTRLSMAKQQARNYDEVFEAVISASRKVAGAPGDIAWRILKRHAAEVGVAPTTMVVGYNHDYAEDVLEAAYFVGALAVPATTGKAFSRLSLKSRIELTDQAAALLNSPGPVAAQPVSGNRPVQSQWQRDVLLAALGFLMLANNNAIAIAKES